MAVVAMMVGLGATSAAAAELSDTGARAFANIAACAATGDHLLAAIVVDSSGSLRQTDPADKRAGAVLTALDSLAQLGGSSSSKLDVQASLATFGSSYDEIVGWGAVRDTHLDSLKSAASTALPDRDRDKFTDYGAALRGAQKALDEKAAALDGASCKVVFWFTDGKLDVGPDTDALRAEICAPQGIADGLRTNDIAVIALALFTSEGRGSVTDQDRERLKSIAEGTGEGESCGTAPIPSTSSTGAYLRADDAGAIRLLFAQATAMLNGATRGLSATCPDSLCVEGKLRIPVDPGIAGFQVIMERLSSNETPSLTAPDGSTATLDPGAKEIKGGKVIVNDHDGLITVDVKVPRATESGEWILAAGASAMAVVDVYYSWGVTLDVEAPDELLVGQEGLVRVVPRDSDGREIDFEMFDSIDLDISLGGESLKAVRNGNAWDVTVQVPSAKVPPTLRVDATAHATTAAHNIKLGPVTGHTELATRLPPSFPTVLPSKLLLPAIEGSGTSTGVLTFTGGTSGVTRACLDSVTVGSPAGAGDLDVRASGSECIDVPANTDVPLEIVVSPEHPADGRVEGTLNVRLEEMDGSQTITVSIPFETTMTRPIDRGALWYSTLLLVLAALGAAWATADISRRVAERFVLGPDARVASVPVVATATRVTRADGPILLDAAKDFQPIGFLNKRRVPRFAAAGLNYQRAFPWFPLRQAQPYVETDDGIVVVPGGDQLMIGLDGKRAPVRLPGTLGFVFVAEPAPAPNEDGSVRGKLVTIIDSPDGVSSVLDERISEIENAPWERILDAVKAARAARAGATASVVVASESAERQPSTDGVVIESLPSMDWDDDSARPLQTLREASPRTGKRFARKPKKAPDVAPPTHPVVRELDDQPDAPPSPTINFWD
ncbi:VWA domain-containing protein [Diaminobutyricimonas sp. LJ205]|uniref:VWA domain-containing protein n=1 Tax=Diaminobutyricimonas sp. LJ205 TaxID=2683590 RepID=UPI0012F4DFC9|nr:VWA domain-containing protein [Diaminobutyricimonas sp. LJ205]